MPKLSSIIKNIDCKLINIKEDLEIDYITDDSNNVEYNSMFVCIVGKNIDGHKFALDALSFGAKVIVAEHELPLNCSQIIVKNTREIIGLLAKNFYNLSSNLKIITVVGTCGKSTTSCMIYHSLKYLGKKVGIIGTSKIEYNDVSVEFNMTTPDPLLLYKTLSDMENCDVEYVVMEVSAHAIHFYKTNGLTAICTIYTNFSQDHLDFFKSMEKYKQTKASYFKKENTKYAIINTDDDLGLELISKISIPFQTFGIKNPSNIFAINIKMDLSGSSFVVSIDDCVTNFTIKIPALYNIYNALSVITLLNYMKFSTQDIVKAMHSFEGVKGRFEVLQINKKTIIIDYAHTPESIKSVLQTVKSLSKDKIYCVFGCPGNRDEKKRKIMGKIVAENSNFVVITSDNPHYENENRIIQQIVEGVKDISSNYVIENDRAKAIKYAITNSPAKCNIVICGKGDEKYQDLNNYKVPYNDLESVKNLIKKGN